MGYVLRQTDAVITDVGPLPFVPPSPNLNVFVNGSLAAVTSELLPAKLAEHILVAITHISLIPPNPLVEARVFVGPANTAFVTSAHQIQSPPCAPLYINSLTPFANNVFVGPI